MPTNILMPALSPTMEKGNLAKWLKKEGDKVSPGDVIAEIETDKATMEQQSFDDGTMAYHAAPEGKTVAVGSLIAVIATAGEDWHQVKTQYAGATGSTGAQATSPKAAAQGGTPKQPPSSATALAEPPRPHAGDNDRVFASPLARKIAAERGLDLSMIEGTGPSGRITRKDVEAAGSTPLRGVATVAPQRAATQPARPATPLSAGHVPSTPEAMIPPPGALLTARTLPLSTMRRVIATRLVESKTTIPHYQVTVEASMDSLLALRQQLNDQLSPQGIKLSVNDFLVRACALAVHQHPFVNSRWSDDGPSIQILGDANIGIAIALPEERGGGLVVGTIRNADRLGLRLISQQSKALSEKARAKGLSPEEMSDSTFTISNLGMFGVEHFTAIINPPNVAILAVGAALKKPVAKDDQIVLGHRMQMTMSSDHRVVDGAMAAAYLNTVKAMLEAPATLLV